MVNLNKTITISEIILFNRGDCCGRRLSNFRVSVLDMSRNEVFGQHFVGRVVQGGSQSFEIPYGATGSIDRVMLNGKNLEGNGHISLAEVRMMGYEN